MAGDPVGAAAADPAKPPEASALDPSEFRRPKGRGPTRHLYLANCGRGCGQTSEAVIAAFRAAVPGVEVEAFHLGDTGVSYASFSTPEVAARVREGVAAAHPWVIRYAERAEAVRTTVPGSVDATGDVEVPGLEVALDFVSETEAQALLDEVDALPWDTSIRRRVQHYGHAFDYARLRLAEGELQHMPEACRGIARRVSDRIQRPVNQLTVNEYQPGVGIASHCDAHSAFEDCIVALTLGSGIVMEFRKPEPDSGGKVSVGKHHRLAPPPPEAETQALLTKNVWLPANSLLIIRDEARYAWQHGIAWRKTDCLVAGEPVPRGRRVSLTYRAARFQPCACAWPLLCDAQNPEAHVLPSRIGEPSAADAEAADANGPAEL